MNQETMQHLPLASITSKIQVRVEFSEPEIAALATSMKEVGQLQPIRVRRDGDRFIVINGERRFRAAELAGWSTIMVIVEEESLGEERILQKQLVENCQRVDLTPIETARAVAQLMNVTRWNATETATHLGMSNAMISRLLAILKLPEPILRDVESGRIPSSTAYEIARLDDPDKQASMAREAANGRLTRDAARGTVRRARRTSSNSPSPALKRASVVLSKGWSVTVIGEELDFDGFITSCEAALAKAKKARNQSLSFQTFLKVARDQGKS